MRRRALGLAMVLAALALLAAWWLRPAPGAPMGAPARERVAVAPVAPSAGEVERREVRRRRPAARPVPTPEIAAPVPDDEVHRRSWASWRSCAAVPGAEGLSGPVVDEYGNWIGFLTADEAGSELRTRWEVGEGEVRFEQHTPASISWTATGCVVAPGRVEPLPGWIRGFVENAEQGEVFVEGCGVSFLRVADSRFEIRAVQEPCALLAVRFNGALSTPGPSVEVTPTPEGTRVTLWAPDWKPAGLGIQLEAGDEGVRVVGVLEGTPAEEAGLRQGDVVVGLDGEAVPGMSLEEFVALAIGEEGTEVELRVRGADGERTLRIQRRTIERTH